MPYYTPGTYTGTATGIGEVKVTMTFSETAITDVVIDASNETESIGGVAAPTLQDAIMAAQNAEIDNVSGATVTTNAVKKAAASCIEQAMGVASEEPAADTAGDTGDDWLGEEPDVQASETQDFDVVIIRRRSVRRLRCPCGCRGGRKSCHRGKELFLQLPQRRVCPAERQPEQALGP